MMFRSPFFPVPYQHLPNRPRLELVKRGELDIPGFEITGAALNHPGGALAYRIRGVTGDFVYATDHEFGDPEYDKPLATFARGPPRSSSTRTSRRRSCRSIADGATATGGSCAEFAAANDIGGLWLFHHKPGRTDEELVRIRTDARRIFPATETASEGDALQL